MFKLDPQNRLPIYEQLKQKIEQLILIGDLKKDDPLPSVRKIANDLGINPNTVQKAYKQLEANHIIYSVAGIGSFIKIDKQTDKTFSQSYQASLEESLLLAQKAGMSKQQILQLVNRIFTIKEESDK